MATGHFENGRSETFKVQQPLAVRKGDIVSVIVGSRDRNHVCDTTHVVLNVIESGGAGRKWNLADDVVEAIHAANPHADSLGNDGVWHFYARDGKQKPSKPVLAAGSALERWRAAAASGATAQELVPLGAAVQARLDEGSRALTEADRAVSRSLRRWDGPLGWIARRRSRAGGSLPDAAPAGPAFGVDPALFGRHPEGHATDPESLVVRAPATVSVSLPSALLNDAEFVVEGRLAPNADSEGSVQLQVLTGKPEVAPGMRAGVPVVTQSKSKARRRLAAAYEDFRKLFPAAMCYARIVPVDEAVTLLLYHREDEPLARLMLDDAARKRLNRLWNALRFVSHDAVRIEVALEQILEFATQDGDPKKFDPVRQPIADNAEAFRRGLVEAEPEHLDALLAFADRAYRRPLAEDERVRLTGLYRALREEGRSHGDAFRATLARILIAPVVLYKVEHPAPGHEARPVTDLELASRLSYFLWASMPDSDLRRVAEVGMLRDPATLTAQARRMLGDGRVRSMAVEFMAQWVGVRRFDEHDEKNEAVYPEFAALRGPMYEETLRFFEDLIRRDGSVLDLINADHTFVNDALAKHYALKDVKGPQWRRVDGIRGHGRGVILGTRA
ncbi:MAG: DUF1592 domain-containing protein, partial [Phycisphaerae bacterium]|nr:DUF1592 domain-containing protein [Phycisphaerae bacterium]